MSFSRLVITFNARDKKLFKLVTDNLKAQKIIGLSTIEFSGNKQYEVFTRSFNDNPYQKTILFHDDNFFDYDYLNFEIELLSKIGNRWRPILINQLNDNSIEIIRNNRIKSIHSDFIKKFLIDNFNYTESKKFANILECKK